MIRWMDNDDDNDIGLTQADTWDYIAFPADTVSVTSFLRTRKRSSLRYWEDAVGRE